MTPLVAILRIHNQNITVAAHDGGEEDRWASVVAGCDASPVFNPAEHPLDHCPAVHCVAIAREGRLHRL